MARGYRNPAVFPAVGAPPSYALWCEWSCVMNPYPNLPEASWLTKPDKFRSAAPLLYVAGLAAVLALSVLLARLS